jgi:hypothetical protein
MPAFKAMDPFKRIQSSLKHKRNLSNAELLPRSVAFASAASVHLRAMDELWILKWGVDHCGWLTNDSATVMSSPATKIGIFFFFKTQGICFYFMVKIALKTTLY